MDDCALADSIIVQLKTNVNKVFMIIKLNELPRGRAPRYQKSNVSWFLYIFLYSFCLPWSPLYIFVSFLHLRIVQPYWHNIHLSRNYLPIISLLFLDDDDIALWLLYFLSSLLFLIRSLWIHFVLKSVLGLSHIQSQQNESHSARKSVYKSPSNLFQYLPLLPPPIFHWTYYMIQ